MFQYPKLTHMTLPSVESWGSDMNILRDPPKALYTRKVDKVFDTNFLKDMIDDSGDRIAECISVFPRGVNPMASVSYDNFSNNAGLRGSNRTLSSQTQAYLPYRIMREGVFRPPILTARDLLPLSRLPRVWTEGVVSSPDFSSFADRQSCPDTFRSIKENVINLCSRPTAVYKIDVPVEGFSTDYAITDNRIQVPATSGVRTQDILERENKTPNHTLTDIRQMSRTTNPGSQNNTKNLEVNINTDNYTIDPRHSTITSHISSNKFLTPLENQSNKEIHLKDPHYTSYTTPLRGNEAFQSQDEKNIDLRKKNDLGAFSTNLTNDRNYIRINSDNELELDRNLPKREARTNPVTQSAGGSLYTGSRDFKLAPSLSYGSFENNGTRPMLNNWNNYTDNSATHESMSKQVRRKAFEQNQDRFLSLPQFGEVN